MLGYIESNFSMYLLSYGQVEIQDSDIKTSKLGTCSTDLLLLNSQVNTTGRGCAADSGMGKGLITPGCSGSGASHSGFGAYGAKSNLSDSTLDCTKFYGKPYGTRETDAMYVGSGGASVMDNNNTL